MKCIVRIQHWYSILPSVITHDFGGSKGGEGQVQSSGAVAGAKGRASDMRRRRGAGCWRTVVTKRASRRRGPANV